ncbi:glycosyltransferase [Gammaproteobacteria bacterium]|nr:glycosyltransferase [Gammaproteobacteria bacterium]
MSIEGPAENKNRVSIICRSLGRPELQQALRSIASQDYPNIEIVLVDAAGDDYLDSVAAGDRPLKLVTTGAVLSRSQAANAGLKAAQGKYIQFLDDDDWIDPNHVSQLVSVLELSDETAAAYSSTQKTNAAGDSLDYVFREDFDPILLMRDNYIPIHSVLFESALLENGCGFDEAFDIYEDWDFWLQLSQHTNFQHIDSVTAYYREGGDSNTAVADVRLRYQGENILGKGRAAIFEKWLPKWTGDQMNALIGQLDQSVLLCDQDTRIHSELKKNAELQYEIENRDTKIIELDLQMEQQTQHMEQQTQHINELNLQMEQQTQNFKNLEAHTEQLQHAHELIEHSIFWRMTYPLRLLRNAVAPGSKKQDAVKEILAIENSEQATGQIEGQQLEKQKLDNSAKGALDKFLTSTEQLQFPETETPQLSIILVFYQQAHLSYLCLQSLLEFANVCYELIIVDNNSTDETAKLLNKIDNATIIRNADNCGFVKAVNQAAGIATGEYILLLNNDALIEKNTLSNALQVIKSDKSIGAVGAKIKLLDGSIQEAGSIIFSDGACLGYGRGNVSDNYEFMFQRDVDYCSGAFLLFRNSTFKALGGFDLDYAPAYYEESDFCIRLQKKGLRIVYVPSSQITHYEFASCGGMENAQKLQAKHREVLCTKHADYLAEQFANDDSKVLHARTRNNFPNILVIDDRVPHPSLGSGYPRCSSMLFELSKMDLNISLYPLQFPEEQWDDVYNTLPSTIEVILESGRDGLQSFLAERKKFFQFIVVSRVHNMEFFNHCLSLDPDLLGDAKIIYDAEAVSAPREILRMEFHGEAMSAEDQAKLIEKELQQSKLAGKIVAVSNNEAEIFKRHGYSNTVVLGHTIASKPGRKEFKQRSGLLFVGALRDEGSPNVDSLLWFLINVFPILEQAIPGIKLNVVGDNSAPSLATIGKDNINFTGRVHSIEEIYNISRVFIAPTRFAAGIPHKIHEAAAKGLPSVTTPLLAQQLGWKDSKELLVGDTPEAYAAQCIKLYQDEKLWQDVRDAGLAAIIEDCSQETFRKKLAGLFS